MNPLSQALLTGLMLRFGFRDRTDVDAAWSALIERLGPERAGQAVETAIEAATSSLPERAPNELVGRALATAMKTLLDEWAPKLTPGLVVEHAGSTDNPILDVLVASWRARTSDVLNDETEQAWWESLVERFGEPGSLLRIEAALSASLTETVRVEADPDRHAMEVGQSIVRRLLRLVDSAKGAPA